MAALDPQTKYIIKFPLGDEDECARCDREREIYQLLEGSPHPRPSSLLGFHGSTSHGILLEYTELGPVRQYLAETQSQWPVLLCPVGRSKQQKHYDPFTQMGSVMATSVVRISSWTNL